jgi:SAM-dependent methyltransferase
VKPALVKQLVCPGCREALGLAAEAVEGEEIMTGALTCALCRTVYPVLRGVPRFVDGSAYAASFGRQWTWFSRVQLDSMTRRDESERTFEATTGWSDDDCFGRLVLDAGVGAGRFAEVVAKKGGEVIGVDLSSAIDAAFGNIGRRPGVHLVQADLFAMPFRDGTFDRAYSIGVLHHTPDPAAAFARVARTVKTGGDLAVYVYARYGPGHRMSDRIRTVTTRLPHSVMLAVAALAIPGYYLYRAPVLGKALDLVCPISKHPDWRWRWLDTFDWYTPRFQHKYLYPEVYRWFRDNGLRDVQIFDDPIRMRGVKA